MRAAREMKNAGVDSFACFFVKVILMVNNKNIKTR
jgi:hypothetical protein